MKNYKLQITNCGLRALVILHFAFCLFNCPAITPFYVQLFNSDGSAQTNQIGVSFWPPSDSPYVVYGTNLIHEGNILTIVPNSSGYSSNAMFAGTYRFYQTNLNAAFIVNIPDTTNFQSIALYVTNLQVFSGVGLNSYQLITNLLGFAPPTNTAARLIETLNFQPLTNTLAGVTNITGVIGTIASRSSNDFFLASSAGTIAGRASNDFFLAASAGTIASRGSNDFALASAAGITNNLGFIPANAANTNDFARVTALGSIAGRGSNDFALAAADGLSLSISNLTNVKVITNGVICILDYKTNGLPGSAFTNYPNGSFMLTTNGGAYVLSNLVWHAIAQ